MAGLGSSTNYLSLHLSDSVLTPILSSSRPLSSRRHSETQAQALSSLTTIAISAFDSASRLGLGVPQRVMVETSGSGPMILHSYLSPQSTRRPHSRRTPSNESSRDIIQQARDDMRPLTATTNAENGEAQEESTQSVVNGVVNGDEVPGSENGEEDEENGIQPPPLLIATVIAPSATDAREARRAAAALERQGREFQRQWVREQEEVHQPVIIGDAEGDDG